MRCPFAEWRGEGLSNMTPGGMIDHRGLVLHIQQGIEAGTDSWFHNPAAQASAHFGAAKDGGLQQWVDTDDKAWAESAGNPNWISVECEGYSGESLTDAQVATIGDLYAWLRTLYRVPLVVTDDAATPGLGWHGMGGQAWGGHLDCPGEPIKAQRGAILIRAAGKPQPQPKGDDMVLPQAVDPVTGGTWTCKPDGSIFTDDRAPYLGGLNNHPDWKAGGPDMPAVAIAYWAGSGHAADGMGYKITTMTLATGELHYYRFPRSGVYK